METHSGHWERWCRLCGKYDPENCIDFQNRVVLNGLSDDIKLTVEQAMEKYLCLKTSDECIRAKSICNECYSYLVLHINFTQRVQRVQEMFKFLELTPMDELYDLESVRIKFNLSADSILAESADPKYNFTKCVDSLTEVAIKEELSGPEDGDESLTTKNIESKEDPLHCGDGNPSAISVKTEPGNESSNLTCETMTVDARVNLGKYKRKRIPRKENAQIDTEASSSTKVKVNTTNDFPLDVSCEQCKESFTFFSLYYKHLKLRHLESVKGNDWVCPICESVLQTRYTFKRHMRLHMPAKPLPIKCPQCDKRYQTNAQLEKHIKQRHCDEKRYKCEECGIGINTLFNLKQHISTHSNQTQMSLHMPPERLLIKCTQCDNCYETKVQLATHIRQIHCNEKPYICEECGIRTSTLSNLKQHISTHSNLTPFGCKICKKNFKSRALLKRHLDTHDPKKHKCSICGLELSSRITLRRHFLVHSDDMQHKCDYCGRAFKRSKTLKTHLLLHTGLQPYSCDFCDRTFANGSNCRSHMKKMHPIELASLEESGGRSHTQNIPKLVNLKALTKAADQLTPVAALSDGCIPVD